MDYTGKARALRAKAADKAVTPEERATLIAKAEELEAKYGKQSSPITDDTTTTSRDGRYNPFQRPPGYQHQTYATGDRFVYWTSPPSEEEIRRRYEDAVRQTHRLFEQQFMWNRPPKEDADNLYEEEYKYEPEEDENEDEGYEGY